MIGSVFRLLSSAVFIHKSFNKTQSSRTKEYKTLIFIPLQHKDTKVTKMLAHLIESENTDSTSKVAHCESSLMTSDC